MIRVLIADDHAIVRDGIKRLFSMVDDIHVVSEACDGGQVMDSVRNAKIDLVLLDISMPGISGVELINRIRMYDPKLPILVLSMHNESQIARRAIKSGANGYLTKDSDPEALLLAIHQVAAGGRCITPHLATQMAFEPDIPSEMPHKHLSNREYNVLCLLGQGMSIADIAQKYSISSKTVSTYKARVMQKMQFQSNAELVRYVVKHNLNS